MGRTSPHPSSQRGNHQTWMGIGLSIKKGNYIIMRYGIECKIRDTTSFFTSWVDAESSSEALAKFKQGKVYREQQSSKLDIIRVVEMQSK